MSIAISALRSLNIFHKQTVQLSSHFSLVNRIHANSKASFGFSEPGTSTLRIRGENGGDGTEKDVDEDEIESRGESSMPERFRYLMKEAPEKPLRWPLFIVLAFLLYAWRTVLWELSNWMKPVTYVLEPLFISIGFIFRIAFASILHLLTYPLVASVSFVDTTLHNIHALYSLVINQAPIQELTKMIILASFVLFMAKSVVPDSVNSQPYLLTISAVIGFLAVRGYISEPLFWTLLIGLFSFGRWVKKRDYVSSTLPVAAVLAAVGEPWVQAVVMVSYLTLAIVQHSRKPIDQKEGEGPQWQRGFRLL
ncbi:unnamed protein product [Cuscuta epithymum]|uniref:Uncharacterized protein n=1 Tax=Cuscuta epithymum TaxID=186058 RepID=A0AAV0EBF6_9ASTE|nr:unnamed protein product [Cuscuta epithymum]CAH9121218.1 unnamed protein product [Cuscuta epithymum]